MDEVMRQNDLKKMCCWNCKYFKLFPQFKRAGQCERELDSRLHDFLDSIKSSSDICDDWKERMGYERTTIGSCHNCPLAFFTYYYFNTRCKGLPKNQVMTEEQRKQMYSGYFIEGRDLPVPPQWCPRLKNTHVKY